MKWPTRAPAATSRCFSCRLFPFKCVILLLSFVFGLLLIPISLSFSSFSRKSRNITEWNRRNSRQQKSFRVNDVRYKRSRPRGSTFSSAYKAFKRIAFFAPVQYRSDSFFGVKKKNYKKKTGNRIVEDAQLQWISNRGKRRTIYIKHELKKQNKKRP